MGFGCRRFNRILNEIGDREPTSRENRFLERHRLVCESCRQEEQAASLSLDLLRGAFMEAEPELAFDRRVLRQARVNMVRDGVRYWSPALVGGLVAAGLVLAAVQALTKPISTSTPGTYEAKTRGKQETPLVLATPPRFNR